jgi:uncharacterized MAPEG superfamily protein
MSPAAVALIAFACWTLLLVLGIGLLRTAVFLGGGRPSLRFDPGGGDVSPFSERLARAHANCYENLPIFGALVAVGLATGQAAAIDSLAMWVLYARIGQSLVHLASVSPIAIQLRFALYLAQWFLMLTMAWRLLGA